jgi:hypothetical protein
MNENQEFLLRFTNSGIDVMEASFAWSKESNALLNSVMDPVNLLMGFARCMPDFTEKICGDAGINLAEFMKHANIAAGTPTHFKNYASMSYETFYDWFRDMGNEFIAPSLIFVLNKANQRAAREGRRINHLDLMYGLAVTNHWGNRMGNVLGKAGWSVGDMGANQHVWREAIEAYIANTNS